MTMPMPPDGLTRSDDLPQMELPPGMGSVAPLSGAPEGLCAVLTLEAGDGFDFHRHPSQDETIYCLKGHGDAWVDQEQTTVGPGDVMVLPRGTVHSLFNRSGSRLRVLIVLSPLLPDYEEDMEVVDGYGWEMEDVSEQQPWASLR